MNETRLASLRAAPQLGFWSYPKQMRAVGTQRQPKSELCPNKYEKYGISKSFGRTRAATAGSARPQCRDFYSAADTFSPRAACFERRQRPPTTRTRIAPKRAANSTM